MNALLVFLGGGLGSLARWSLAVGIQSLAEKTSLHRFPIGILTCNVLGCFLIGCLFGYFTNKTTPPWVFPLLATGFLGGFTTFSTFAKDTHTLWTSGLTALAVAKIVLSILLGLAAVWAGIRLSHSA
ncbi:fluoride efflux transporter CrcB [bacterium]|nr:fluoride efflux transporter CrcB [Akkermansiaceae bacterium]MDB4406935.1 fluoride efflux transporter CrcB [bacterium]MDB4275028.1 fluoride efflux transporter CrcB [Akkermansiaceae bacterium]MDB4356677.1 fluoride efflux transporter CrcB [Akkermansiaceae bacterium]MDB4411043.1 fluoride efflux transporter CrcB [bacterium]